MNKSEELHQKLWKSHWCVPFARQPLVKGERLVRYEANAVMDRGLEARALGQGVWEMRWMAVWWQELIGIPIIYRLLYIPGGDRRISSINRTLKSPKTHLANQSCLSQSLPKPHRIHIVLKKLTYLELPKKNVREHFWQLWKFDMSTFCVAFFHLKMTSWKQLIQIPTSSHRALWSFSWTYHDQRSLAQKKQSGRKETLIITVKDAQKLTKQTKPKDY